MSAKPPIIQYWDSTDPPSHIVELTGSFARLNPERPHILFNASSADGFIATHFSQREVAAFRSCRPPAMQADYLRYCAVFQLGGIWSDAGLECARNLSPLLDRSRGGELFRSYVSSSLLMNGLFAFTRPGHPFLRMAVDVSTGLIERRWQGKVNEITGPLVITAIYNLAQAGSVDAFLGEAEKAQAELRLPQLLPYARLVCELIGGYAPSAKACEGVRVSPADHRVEWVRSPPTALSHRHPDSHWSHIAGDIYLEDPK